MGVMVQRRQAFVWKKSSRPLPSKSATSTSYVQWLVPFGTGSRESSGAEILDVGHRPGDREEIHETRPHEIQVSVTVEVRRLQAAPVAVPGHGGDLGERSVRVVEDEVGSGWAGRAEGLPHQEDVVVAVAVAIERAEHVGRRRWRQRRRRSGGPEPVAVAEGRRDDGRISGADAQGVEIAVGVEVSDVLAADERGAEVPSAGPDERPAPRS